MTIGVGGITISYEAYHFYRDLRVGPDTAGWVHIWARPIVEFFEIHICEAYWCFKVFDGVDVFVSNVLTSGMMIQGGVENGLPHEKVTDILFKATSWHPLFIPGTPLEDGELDVDEAIPISLILQHFDKCSRFEIAAPVGALLALAACSILDLNTPACEALLVFLGAFVANIEDEGTSYIGGGLSNHGRESDDGYDVPEILYVRVSNLKHRTQSTWWCFWCSCEFNAPLGLYIEGRNLNTTSSSGGGGDHPGIALPMQDYMENRD